MENKTEQANLMRKTNQKEKVSGKMVKESNGQIDFKIDKIKNNLSYYFSIQMCFYQIIKYHS